MEMERLETQLGFVLEVEQLKQVFRQTVLMGDRRRENDAEHSWHLSLMAILQPLLLNFHTKGAAWQKRGIKKAQVVARNEHIGEGAPALWAYAQKLIDAAVAKGYMGE